MAKSFCEQLRNVNVRLIPPTNIITLATNASKITILVMENASLVGRVRSITPPKESANVTKQMGIFSKDQTRRLALLAITQTTLIISSLPANPVLKG